MKKNKSLIIGISIVAVIGIIVLIIFLSRRIKTDTKTTDDMKTPDTKTDTVQQTSAQCSGMIRAAKDRTKGRTCLQSNIKMKCPVGGEFMITNGCIADVLKQQGWTMVN